MDHPNRFKNILKVQKRVSLTLAVRGKTHLVEDLRDDGLSEDRDVLRPLADEGGRQDVHYGEAARGKAVA